MTVTNPVEELKTGIKFIERIQAQGRTAQSKSFLEIGTGRRLNLPISIWLCGAERIFTVDVNPYLTTELVIEDIEYIRHNNDKIIELFGVHARQPLFMERFKKLLSWRGKDIYSFLTAINTTYIIQRDSSRLILPPHSIDYHISRCVFEHIPPKVLERMVHESKKLLRIDGLLLHLVDFSDHFSHSDKSISSVNFLQYSECVWSLLAGNRFMYHNRLRIDDFLMMFSDAGLRIVEQEVEIDEKALRSLKEGFRLDKRFRNKPMSVNATASAWILAKIPDMAAV